MNKEHEDRVHKTLSDEEAEYFAKDFHVSDEEEELITQKIHELQQFLDKYEVPFVLGVILGKKGNQTHEMHAAILPGQRAIGKFRFASEVLQHGEQAVLEHMAKTVLQQAVNATEEETPKETPLGFMTSEKPTIH